MLQNFQAVHDVIFLQAHSIKLPWLILSKIHCPILREEVKVCCWHVLLMSPALEWPSLEGMLALTVFSAKDDKSW